MHVAIVHNAVSANDSEADRDVLDQVEVVGQALGTLGHRHDIVPCTLNLEQLRSRLAALRPDCVFNLVESLAGCDSLVIAATGLFEAMNLPYAGGSTASLLLTNHKLLAKERMRQAGIPTPDWTDDRSAAASTEPFRAPYIIKAVSEHASFGLDEESVFLEDQGVDVGERLAHYAARHGKPGFAEQYIDGREFNVSVVGGPNGPEVLPPAEIDFSAFPEGKIRVVGHRAKWKNHSFEYHNTPPQFSFTVSDTTLLERIARIALDCWQAFRLRGWARVDFRVDRGGRPWVLEINVNPCLSADAGFVAALNRAGISFSEALARILADIEPI